MKIAVDWDDTLERNFVKNEVMKWIKAGHTVEIVTTRWENVANYPWYREGIDDELHKPLFKFAKLAKIPYYFTNMEYKAKYVEENNFDYLVDDNPEEEEGLINCKFINVNDVFKLTEILLKE